MYSFLKSAMLWIALVAVVAWAELAPRAALADDFSTNVERCGGEGYDPDLQIGACTWLLNSGQLAEESLFVTFYNRALSWQRKEEYDNAIADYSEAIRLNPTDSWSYYNRGNAWRSKGEFVSAVNDYSEAIRINPQDAWAYYNRGLAWESLGEQGNADADYTEALRLDPDLEVY